MRAMSVLHSASGLPRYLPACRNVAANRRVLAHLCKIIEACKRKQRFSVLCLYALRSTQNFRQEEVRVQQTAVPRWLTGGAAFFGTSLRNCWGVRSNPPNPTLATRLMVQCHLSPHLVCTSSTVRQDTAFGSSEPRICAQKPSSERNNKKLAKEVSLLFNSAASNL